ncbi:T-cell surface antigen CD2 [Gadus morhua]|uniref:T-cell surface antigen CD2 n=1 Tax=Gadus morhua TaxID=8049 RepID=A0A8C5CHG6_GADMO|nr:T-cell surface antigen CD2 [Gadus morhua]
MELFPVCLFLLAAFTAASSAGPQESNRYVAAGSETITMELPAGTHVSELDKLIWKRNGSLVYIKGNKKAINNKFTVSPNWALNVPAAELLVVGQVSVYTLEVHDTQGKEKVTMKTILHLLEKVRTPTLTINCMDKDNAVFTCFCNISQTQDLVYEWKLNGAVQSGKDKVFKVPRKPVWKSVSCEVSNKAGKESSVASEAKCIDSSVPAVLYQIYQKYFWYIVGGGGGLVLLLFFITVLCCVRARTRRKNRMQTESEMRLEWTNQTPRQDQQQQREKKKKKKGPQPGGSQPHRCKSSQDANRSRRKDPAATPLASKDHATSAASSANPARPRPSPRPPQSERDGGLGVDHGPPLPKPRKKAGPKTNSRARP